MFSKIFIAILFSGITSHAIGQTCTSADLNSCPEGYICKHHPWSGSPGFGTCIQNAQPNDTVEGVGVVCAPENAHQTDDVFENTARILADRDAQSKCSGFPAARRKPFEESSDQVCPNGRRMFVASAIYQCQW